MQQEFQNKGLVPPSHLVFWIHQKHLLTDNIEQVYLQASCWSFYVKAEESQVVLGEWKKVRNILDPSRNSLLLGKRHLNSSLLIHDIFLSSSNDSITWNSLPKELIFTSIRQYLALVMMKITFGISLRFRSVSVIENPD